ncbi:MAG: hypothetical protein ACI802_003868, partial [Candidatus Paceibacteria bacterium]
GAKRNRLVQRGCGAAAGVVALGAGVFTRTCLICPTLSHLYIHSDY